MTVRNVRGRLDKLERERRKRGDTDRPMTLSEFFGGPYDPTSTLATLLAQVDSAGPLPPKGQSGNVFDVDAEIAKLDLEQRE